MTAGLLAAEWTKIRSVRSTVWTLLVFVVVAIGFSALIATVISNTWNNPGNHPNHVTLVTDPTAVLFGAGFGLGQLAMCVLGVIVISSEYSTGAIRSSLLAVPRRIPMLTAKALIFGLLDFVVSAITVFAVFFITTAILRSHISITLSTTGVTRACIGGILYLTVLGLFSLAITDPKWVRAYASESELGRVHPGMRAFVARTRPLLASSTATPGHPPTASRRPSGLRAT